MTDAERIARGIRRDTQDGEEIFRFLVMVMRAEVPGRRSTLQQRMRAAELLLNRSFGRIPGKVELPQTQRKLDFDRLTTAELVEFQAHTKALEELRQKALPAAVGT